MFIHLLFNCVVGSVSPPRSKRQKYDPVLGQVPLTTSMIQHVDHWQKKLIEFYLLQEKSTDAWPPLKVVHFVQLALIKQDETNRHIGLHTISDDIDAVYGEKTSVEFDHLFENLEHRSLVLIEGRPGSGKTTLMVKVSCDWARKKVLKLKKLVLFVRLRHLRKDSDIYLHDLLKVACTAFSNDEVQGISSYIEGRLGEDVVFVLDGFDEYAPGARNESFISKLVLKQVYSRSVVIVSSRPAATQRFRQKATKWIEVVGFMKEQVIEYVDTYFRTKNDLAKQLNEHLEKHPNLMNMCYLPLHCAMLVFLYEEEEFLPKTETEFYKHFTLSTLIRCVHKQCEDPGNPFQLSSYDDLPYEEKDLFEKICELAFQATVNSQQVFKRSDLDKICLQFEDKNSLGLVMIDRYFVTYGLNETYSFLHLTFQEYLSAVHLANLGEYRLCFTIPTILQNCGQMLPYQSILGQTQQVSTLVPHRRQHLVCPPNLNHLHTGADNEYDRCENAPKFDVTFKFLLGMIDFSKTNAMDIFKLILKSNDDDILYLLACAFEAQHPSPCNHLLQDNTLHISRSQKLPMNASTLDVNTLDMMHIAYVINNANSVTPKVYFDNCNYNSEAALTLLQGIGDHKISLMIM